MSDFQPTNAKTAQCRLGGLCELYSRDSYLGGYRGLGIAQCKKCSQVYEAQQWVKRVCAHCEKPYGESLHDPCLGELPPDPEHGRVTQACCGHGDETQAYRIYADATRVNGLIP